MVSKKLTPIGDRVVITAGVPFGFSGTTNILRVAEIEDPNIPHGPYRSHHSD